MVIIIWGEWVNYIITLIVGLFFLSEWITWVLLVVEFMF